ncbi:MnhB domain-containing protein [Verrucomicrobiota bacterium]
MNAEPLEASDIARLNKVRGEGMSLIVKTVARWLKAVILLFGIYIVLYGHLTPGGGFAGGVIVACAFILLTLAEGQRVGLQTVSKLLASELESIGALIFLGVGLAGLLFAKVFFTNFVETPPEARHDLLSAGLMPLSNIGIGIKVGMSLFMVFTILAATHVAIHNGERKMRQRKGN